MCISHLAGFNTADSTLPDRMPAVVQIFHISLIIARIVLTEGRDGWRSAVHERVKLLVRDMLGYYLAWIKEDCAN